MRDSLQERNAEAAFPLPQAGEGQGEGVQNAVSIPVSIIIMTRNEEANIGRCLDALRGFDQVFVVDSGSTDATLQIAKEHGVAVVSFVWNGRYPKKKQWCLENLPFRHDWVFYVDADEIVTPELCDEIAAAVANPGDIVGFYIRGKAVVHGRVLQHGQPHRKLSLLNRHKSHFPVCNDLDITKMWEVEGHYQPIVDGRIGMLRNALIHHDCKSLYAWFERHNRYSDWEAILRTRDDLSAMSGKEPLIRRMMKHLFNVLPFRPLALFLYSYILKAGFLDGRAGFDYAIMRAFYYWMIEVKGRETKS